MNDYPKRCIYLAETCCLADTLFSACAIVSLPSCSAITPAPVHRNPASTPVLMRVLDGEWLSSQSVRTRPVSTVARARPARRLPPLLPASLAPHMLAGANSSFRS